MRVLTLLFGLAMCVGGCTAGRTYEVSVHNATGSPVTIWLTKDGPPAENRWLSPEQIAIDPTNAPREIGGVVIPPGKSADTGRVKGQFYSDVNAVLRVYEGQLTLSQLLAISHGSPNRVDQVLPRGQSRWVVEETPKLQINPEP